MRAHLLRNVVFASLPITLCVASAHGQNATDLYKQVLSRCAKSDELGKNTVFFGVSNSLGPGSVWRRDPGDKSIRLRFELSDAFPQSPDQQKVIVINQLSSCNGSSSTKWNLSVGLPFTLSSTTLAGELSTVLSHAHQVDVSIKEFAVDNLKELPFLEAFKTLPTDNAYRKDLAEDDRIVAENVVKVAGLKAVFKFNGDIDVNAKAKFTGSSFTLGSILADPSSGSPSTTTPPTAAPAQTGSPATTPAADPCAVSSQVPGAASTVSSNNTPTVHVTVDTSRQITLCATGPFYLLAAYGKLIGGGFGAAPGAASLHLEPVKLSPSH
jgi:hypothetical protein